MHGPFNPHKDKIIELHFNRYNYSFDDIGKMVGQTRNQVAGVVWRYKNPKMWKKNTKLRDRTRQQHG